MAEQKPEYPFRCRLSLAPLIDYLRQNLQLPGVADLLDQVDQGAPELGQPIDDLAILETHRSLVNRLMCYVFSPTYWEREPVAAVVPFKVEPFHVSPRFEELFLAQDQGVLDSLTLDQESVRRGRVIRAYLFILDRLYGIKKDFEYPLNRIVKDPKTGLESHWRLHFDFRFVRVHSRGELVPLDEERKEFVLENLVEPEKLKQVLPPQEYEIHGFTMIQALDVTGPQMVTALQTEIINRESVVSNQGFLRIQGYLRNYFQRADLEVSLAAVHDDCIMLLNSGNTVPHQCLFTDGTHVSLDAFKETVFERALRSDEIIRVSDLAQEPTLMQLDPDFAHSGMRSMLIAPLHYQGVCLGCLNLKSPHIGDLGPMEALRLSYLQPLFALAVKKALDDLQNQVQSVIKENCTAIHPSVEWRFQKAALHLLQQRRSGNQAELEPIVFNDVYPLSGISDIRGSTEVRNQAILDDLTEHLDLALKVVRLASEASPLMILGELAARIRAQMERISLGLSSGDDHAVISFLRGQVEGIFPELKGLGPKVLRAIQEYKDRVDPGLGTIYKRRKDFEASVATLNCRLASYLDQENARMQKVLPHYFERRRTDGLDYLAYLGPTLNPQGNFSRLHLGNMRLWQLMVACGMAWHTQQIAPQLALPLTTAHLIQVQDTPLSIRFRYDEKRFDVDGAYDVRHQIIRSRLDKATIKGSGERLTQPNLLAVVYSYPQEGMEMRRHLEYLRTLGYVRGDLERVDLEDLPGVQGLKALRAEVDLASAVLSQRAEQMVGAG